MANMRKSTMTCTMTIVAGDEEASHRVTLPILQNVKALKGGDELVLFAEPSAPSSIMPAQKLEQPVRKRPAAAQRLHQPAKKRMSRLSWEFCELHLLVSSFSQVECISRHLCAPTFSKLTLQYRIRRLGVLLQQFVLFHWISSFRT